mgnify:CR=1 FL=1
MFRKRQHNKYITLFINFKTKIQPLIMITVIYIAAHTWHDSIMHWVGSVRSLGGVGGHVPGQAGLAAVGKVMLSLFETSIYTLL